MLEEAEVVAGGVVEAVDRHSRSIGGCRADSIPKDEVVALGRALFSLGAECHTLHKDCVRTPAGRRWLLAKLGEPA
jgi:hypothetical protein